MVFIYIPASKWCKKYRAKDKDNLYLIFHVSRDSERKSMSTERTFREISKPEELFSKCRQLCEALAEDLAQAELKVCHLV